LCNSIFWFSTAILPWKEERDIHDKPSLDMCTDQSISLSERKPCALLSNNHYPRTNHFIKLSKSYLNAAGLIGLIWVRGSAKCTCLLQGVSAHGSRTFDDGAGLFTILGQFELADSTDSTDYHKTLRILVCWLAHNQLWRQ
jgi:hypothetical protein